MKVVQKKIKHKAANFSFERKKHFMSVSKKWKSQLK